MALKDIKMLSPSTCDYHPMWPRDFADVVMSETLKCRDHLGFSPRSLDAIMSILIEENQTEARHRWKQRNDHGNNALCALLLTSEAEEGPGTKECNLQSQTRQEAGSPQSIRSGVSAQTLVLAQY